MRRSEQKEIFLSNLNRAVIEATQLLQGKIWKAQQSKMNWKKVSERLNQIIRELRFVLVVKNQLFFKTRETFRLNSRKRYYNVFIDPPVDYKFRGVQIPLRMNIKIDREFNVSYIIRKVNNASDVNYLLPRDKDKLLKVRTRY